MSDRNRKPNHIDDIEPDDFDDDGDGADDALHSAEDEAAAEADTAEIRQLFTRVATVALSQRREAKTAVPDMDEDRRKSVVKLLESVLDGLDDVEAML